MQGAKRNRIDRRYGLFYRSQARAQPHVRPMGVHRTCGEPNAIELTAALGLLYRSFIHRLHGHGLELDRRPVRDLERAVVCLGWGFFLIPFGSPHARFMGRTSWSARAGNQTKSN